MFSHAIREMMGPSPEAVLRAAATEIGLARSIEILKEERVRVRCLRLNASPSPPSSSKPPPPIPSP
jgi:hypothetical protein